MSLLGLDEVRRRLRPRPATIASGVVGLLLGLGGVCPEQVLLVAVLAAVIAALGLLGDAPDSWGEGWRGTRSGTAWDVRGWLSRAVGPASAWAAVGVVLTALPRWIVSGGC